MDQEKLQSTYLHLDKKIILFWFQVLAIIGMVFLATWDFQPTNSNISAYQITIKEFEEVRSGEYRILAEYCKGINNNALGLVVRSDIEFIPVPVNQNAKNGCEVYGAKINAESKPEIKVRIFQQNDLFNLINELELKKSQLKDQWVLAQQNLIKEFSSTAPNYEAIVSLYAQVQQIQSLLESNKSSMRSLISLQ